MGRGGGGGGGALRAAALRRAARERAKRGAARTPKQARARRTHNANERQQWISRVGAIHNVVGVGHRDEEEEMSSADIKRKRTSSRDLRPAKSRVQRAG